MQSSLRCRTIRLATTRPDLRKYLLPLLEKVAGPTTGRRSYILVFAQNCNYVMTIQWYGVAGPPNLVDEERLSRLSPGEELHIGPERVCKIDVDVLPSRAYQRMFIIYEETPILVSREYLLHNGVQDAALRKLNERARDPETVDSDVGPLKVLAVRSVASGI